MVRVIEKSPVDSTAHAVSNRSPWIQVAPAVIATTTVATVPLKLVKPVRRVHFPASSSSITKIAAAIHVRGRRGGVRTLLSRQHELWWVWPQGLWGVVLLLLLLLLLVVVVVVGLVGVRGRGGLVLTAAGGGGAIWAREEIF